MPGLLDDPITFTNASSPISITYGQSPSVVTAGNPPKVTYTNIIKAGHLGTGTITYTGSQPSSVATVDTNTGVVTILRDGSVTITATKQADLKYKSATKTYTLNISTYKPPAAPAAPTFGSGSAGVSTNTGSITLTAPANAYESLGVKLEYGRSATNAASGASWQTSSTFNSLDNNKVHYFFARFAVETGKFTASDASAVLVAVTTPGTGTSSSDPIKVYDFETLQRVGKSLVNYTNWNLSAHYKMICDIDMTSKSFERIGNYFDRFLGKFDGSGYTINGLAITIYTTQEFNGMFGSIGVGAVVENLKLENCNINITNSNVGGIVGYNDGTVNKCSVTGIVKGNTNIGGIVGSNGDNGKVTNCYAIISITGNDSLGGVAGYNGSTVENCYSTGNIITTGDKVGGIVGFNIEGKVKNCYATGNITGDTYIGGIVGQSNESALVEYCYATGNITGNSYVGGIVGSNNNYSTIRNCVALNPGIIKGSGPETSFGCITGFDDDVDPVYLTNCWTRSDIRILGAPAVFGSIYNPSCGLNGCDAGSNISHSSWWASSTVAWINSGWSTSIWDVSVVDGTYLHILKNMPEGPQNSKITN